MSAPLKQKFICRDKINLTLTNRNFKNYILELSPEISAQPYYVIGKYPNCMLYFNMLKLTMAAF